MVARDEKKEINEVESDKMKEDDITKTETSSDNKNIDISNKPKKENKSRNKKKTTKKINKVIDEKDNDGKNVSAPVSKVNTEATSTPKKKKKTKSSENKTTESNNKNNNENKLKEDKQIEKKSDINKNIEKKESTKFKAENVSNGNSKAKTEDNIEKNNNEKEIKEKTKDNKKSVFLYLLIFIGVLLLVLVAVFVVFAVRNYTRNDVIADGIYIYNIDVSGLSKAEAEEEVTQYFEENILNQNIVLVSEDYETYIELSEIDLEYDISSAVNYAYQVGKDGNMFIDNYEIFTTMVNGVNITPTYSIDEEKLATILEGLSSELPNTVVEGSYYIEDTTLVLTKGTDGYVVNVEETLELVKESIESFDYLENSITLVLSEQSPEELDIDAIYEEVYQEATDAYYTTDPYAVYPSSTGLDFGISLDEAKKLLEEAESECEIELEVLYPSVTTNDIDGDAFPDLIASYTTKYDTSNTDRVTNLKLAANKINGTVLLPGETFSYNQVVGERTIAAGYKEAAIYVNGEVTSGLGGGICQISTTLFNATLLANLEMVEVHNHQMIPSYSSAGRDATVVYGTKDFQFSNSRDYAIKIECSVSGGTVSFKIYGVKEETEYDVSISAKITSQTSSYIKSKTYRTLSLNGETVSSELIYSCTYKVSS